jgi:ribosomal-protein-alanine N-acetyltransferase
MAEVILQTKRLTLRELTWDDLDFVATMLADPLVMRHWPKCYSREEATAWLQKQLDRYREDGHGFWLVSGRNVGTSIGQVGLLRHEIDGVDEAALGYLIHAPFWRQRYATEAAAAVRDYAFNQLAKDRVISLIRPANISSQRVALRIGLKPEKLVMFRDFEHLVFSSSRPVASGRPT